MSPNLFVSFQRAVYEAHKRAGISGHRYRVHYDRLTRLWEIRREVIRLSDRDL